jgi:hypothetical protein
MMADNILFFTRKGYLWDTGQGEWDKAAAQTWKVLHESTTSLMLKNQIVW